MSGKYARYPAYKDSGVEWLGEVPEHWGVVPIKTAATCNDDVLAETTTDDQFEIEYVEISDVDRFRGIIGTTLYPFNAAPTRARRLVKDGDILVSTVRTYLRAITHVKNPPENLVVSTGFAVIRPNRSLPEFVAYIFHSEYLMALIISRSVGISYPAINASDIMQLEIPLPPLPEQQAIAAFLDTQTTRIDALIAEYEKLIALLKEKRQALISHAVTKGLNPDVPMKDSGVEWLGIVPEHWDATKLMYITSRISSGKTPLGGSEVYVDEGVLFLRSQNVYDEGLRLDDVVFITPETDGGMLSSRVIPGDVLLNITGASIGRTCIVPEQFPTANVNQHVCAIRLTREISAHYIGWFLKSSMVKAVIQHSQDGAAREGLTFQDIGNMWVALPPLPEQQAIAAYLDNETAQMDALIHQAETGIDLLKERRTTLISDAVTGKIDVREHVMEVAS